MLISHIKKFIYLKTIKSAGIAGHRGDPWPADKKWLPHTSALEIKNEIATEIWNQYFKFCVIRNPYDRAVSWFYWHKSALNKPKTSIDIERNEFEDWLEKGSFKSDKYIYLINGRVAVDSFIRYESLADDLQDVCSQLDIEWIPENLPVFKSGYRPIHATCENLYSNRAKDLVKNLCLFELNHFNYDFPVC